MNNATATTETLARILEAKAALARAEAELQAAVVAAADAGDDVDAMASAAGVGHGSLYRMTNVGSTQTVWVAEVLEDAAQNLVLLGITTALKVMDTDDVMVRAQVVLAAVASVTDADWKDVGMPRDGSHAEAIEQGRMVAAAIVANPDRVNCPTMRIPAAI